MSPGHKLELFGKMDSPLRIYLHKIDLWVGLGGILLISD